MRKMIQKGFTLIELVVVIAILAILSVIALPEFLEADESAHQAVVGGTGAAFASGLALVKAAFIMQGDKSSCNNIPKFGAETLDVVTSGVVVSVTDPTTECTQDAGHAAADCKAVYDAIMQANAPSTIVGAAGTGGADFTVQFADPTCTYTYENGGTMSFSYDLSGASAGVVTIDDTF